MLEKLCRRRVTGHYYDDGDKKKRFEVYTYNDPLLVVKEFKPDFYDLLLSDIYMPDSMTRWLLLTARMAFSYVKRY